MGKASTPMLKSPLADIITQYVAERRAIGYRCEAEARLLRRLDGCLAGHGLTSVELPRELVRQWLAKTSTSTHARRRLAPA